MIKIKTEVIMGANMLKKKKNLIVYILLLTAFIFSILLFFKYSRTQIFTADKWKNETIASSDLKYSFDKIEKGKIGIRFYGWAFISRNDFKVNEPILIGDIQESRKKQVENLTFWGPTAIGLENVKSNIMYVRKCDKINRSDVGIYYKNSKYSRTGFSTVLNKLNIPHGKYRLYFIFETADGCKYVKSNNEYKV